MSFSWPWARDAAERCWLHRGRALGQGVTFMGLLFSPAARTSEDSRTPQGQDFTVGGSGQSRHGSVGETSQASIAAGFIYERVS